MHIASERATKGTRLGLDSSMKDFLNVPDRDREHFMKCPTCECYFDMRDLAQVVEHEHWDETPAVTFSHSVKVGKESEVHVPTKRGMVTLRPAKRQEVTDKKNVINQR